MNRLFILSTLFLVNATFAYSQDKVILSGTIADKASNETLIGATVIVKEAHGSSSITNAYGFYSITLPKGEYTISVSYLGYEPIEERISLTGNTTKDFYIQEKSKSLDEVVVTANSSRAVISRPEMSVNKLPISVVKKMPAILGEVDVLKSLLQLPGVANAQEGASGFNVRGGSVDGNLVMLDEAIVYNTSHLFGYFSVFNSDVIKDLKLYKGGIPANYGGRVSSVLDIYQKDGNSKEYHATGGIGTVSSRLLIEGPIVKEKSSFVVAGRGTYAHLFLKLANEPNSAYFYDLNAKLNYRINSKNNLFLSGYIGNDLFDMNHAMVNRYGNIFFNARWNHIFSKNVFSNMSVIYSDYEYGLKMKDAGIDWISDIHNYNFKYDFSHHVSNRLSLKYGLNSIYYQFNPGTIRPFDEMSGVHPKQLAKKNALESALYLSTEAKLTDRISLNAGLRLSNFMRLGGEMNKYLNDEAVIYNPEYRIYEEAAPIEVVGFGSTKKMASFTYLEPRLSIAYSLDNNQSIKIGYNRMCQYIHLISNTASVSPLDIWAPSDNYLKPELADQIALGYFRNFQNDAYSLETEVFYKSIKNKADYIDGAELIAHEAIERVLLNGKGRAYGWEVMFRKNTGKLTGWLSYTLSRAEQKTTGRNAEEPGINNGKWYRANYDKLHSLSLTAAYQLTGKWSLGSTFTFQSGKAATFPNGKYEYMGITIANYGERNAKSLAPYHHLDLSATYVFNPSKKKGWQSELVFSIYNVYNRNNAASYTFGQNTTTGLSEAKKMSIFGIIPGITYNFKF